MNYSYMCLIKEVLYEEKKALKIREIWDIAEKKGLTHKLLSVGKTPLKTMNACIHRDLKKGNDAVFEQISKKPALFKLKNDEVMK